MSFPGEVDQVFLLLLLRVGFHSAECGKGFAVILTQRFERGGKDCGDFLF
jgi:hypothetical protein